MPRCEIEIPGCGRCEIDGDHPLDGRGWPIHKRGSMTWNGKRPNEFRVSVRKGAVISAVIGEVDGQFVIWHMAPGKVSPFIVDAENPVTIRISSDV